MASPIPVQAVKFTSSGGTTVSGSITPTAGNNLYVALVFRNSGGGTLTESVTDNHSQTYTRILRKFDPGLVMGVELWCATNIVGAATTITASSGFTGTTVYTDAAALEVSGADATTPNPQSASNSGTSASPDSGSATNTNANSLCIALAGNLDTTNPATFTPPGGWTEQAFDRTNSEMPWSLITKQVTASTAQDATWTAGNSTAWAGLLVIVQSAVPTPVVVPPNNTNWFWSRNNWFINGASYAASTAPGAKFALAWSTPAGGAGQFTLTVDTTPEGGASLSAGSYPTLVYSIDGGALTSAQLSGNSATSTPINLSGLTAGTTHTIQCWIKSIDINSGDRWNTPVQVVRIISATIDNGATTVALSGTNYPVAASEILIFGDSITEGYNTATSGQQDAFQVYGHAVARALGGEASIVGFSGQGWTKAGNVAGNVPAFHTPGGTMTWKSFWSGQSRLSGGTFIKMPDHIIVFHGYNDTGSTDATVTAAVQDFLSQCRAAAPTAHIHIVSPFKTTKIAAIKSGFDAYQTTSPDSKCHFYDLTTLYTVASFTATLSGGGSASIYSFDSTHPNVNGHMTIAALMADAIRKAITSSSSSGGSRRRVWA